MLKATLKDKKSLAAWKENVKKEIYGWINTFAQYCSYFSQYNNYLLKSLLFKSVKFSLFVIIDKFVFPFCACSETVHPLINRNSKINNTKPVKKTPYNL